LKWSLVSIFNIINVINALPGNYHSLLHTAVVCAKRVGTQDKYIGGGQQATLDYFIQKNILSVSGATLIYYLPGFSYYLRENGQYLLMEHG